VACVLCTVQAYACTVHNTHGSYYAAIALATSA